MNAKYQKLDIGRVVDSEGFIHFRSVGVQTGETLCNLLHDTSPCSKRKLVTCFECLGIVHSIASSIERMKEVEA